MLGALAGDIIGSIYERYPVKTKDFPLFDWRCHPTDDTVLTVAVADVLLHGGSYAERFRDYYWRHPEAGYGSSFQRWARSPDSQPYGSWGNGSAMRVSPIGFALNNLDMILVEAKRSAEVTHNHPEGIKGAQAAAAAVFLARTTKSKEAVRSYVVGAFGYDLDSTLDSLRPHYQFDVSCQGTLPAALLSFLESIDFEDAIRNAISLGGDSDTLACITGAIADAYYEGVPDFIQREVLARLAPDLKSITESFTQSLRTQQEPSNWWSRVHKLLHNS